MHRGVEHGREAGQIGRRRRPGLNRAKLPVCRAARGMLQQHCQAIDRGSAHHQRTGQDGARIHHGIQFAQADHHRSAAAFEVIDAQVAQENRYPVVPAKPQLSDADIPVQSGGGEAPGEWREIGVQRPNQRATGREDDQCQQDGGGECDPAARAQSGLLCRRGGRRSLYMCYASPR